MELVIFAGLQAAGKSTFYRTHFATTHVLVSKDLLPNNKNRARRQQQLIPEDLEERMALRLICERTLAFENHFLSIYKEYLLAEFRDATEQALLHALWVLNIIVFQDRQIKEAIEVLAGDSRVEIRDAARSLRVKFV